MRRPGGIGRSCAHLATADRNQFLPDELVGFYAEWLDMAISVSALNDSAGVQRRDTELA